MISDVTNKVVTTIPVGTNPWGVGYDSGKGEVFVTNEGSNNVSVISDASNSVLATIPVGIEPYGVGYDSGKGEVFVANWGWNTVSVISDASNSVLATIPVGIEPYGVTYDSGKGEVFVAKSNSNSVGVISDATNKVVTTIPVGTNPWGVGYDSGKGEVFIANSNSNNVSVISDATNKVVATIPVGYQPYGVAYDSGEGEVFVVNNGNHVSVISDATNKVVATIPVGSGPFDVAYDSGKGEVFVTNSGSSTVSVVSDANNSVVATIPVGTGPVGVAYDSGKGEVFVTNSNSNNVSVISDATNKVVATIPVGGGPNGVGYDSGKGEVFVANSNSNNVSVISDATNKVVATISDGNQPRGVGYDSGKGEVFVTNSNSNNVSVISDASNTITSTVTVGTEPYYAAYDLSNGYVYASNYGQGTISIITTGPTPSTYPVSFSESGLPTGMNWSVILNGQTLSSNTSTVTFKEPNGTYTFSVGTVPGYTTNVTSGNLTVNGGTVSRSIAFIPQATLTSVSVSPSSDTFKVGGYANFTATPTCTGGSCSGVTYSWSLNNTALGNLNTTSGASVKFTAVTRGTENLSVTAMLNGQLAKNSSIITITTTPVPTLTYVSLTPLAATVNVSGTQSFTAAVVCSGGTCPSGSTYTWSLNNSLGKLNASSGPQVLFTANSTVGLVNLTVTAHLNGKTATNSSTITIKKATPPPSTYAVTFSESGLPSGTSWSVALNGAMKSGTGSIVFTEPNGTYSFSVGAVSGYTASPTSGSFTVSGVAVSKAITFTALPPGQYSLIFTETGLPAGTSWSVTLNGSTKSSTTATITFQEPNGSYAFTVGSVSGYTASPSSSSVKVTGAAVSQSITFTSSTSKGKTNQTTGILGLPGYDGYILVGVIVAAVVAGVAILLLRKRSPPRGYGVQDSKNIADRAAEQVAVE